MKILKWTKKKKNWNAQQQHSFSPFIFSILQSQFMLLALFCSCSCFFFKFRMAWRCSCSGLCIAHNISLARQSEIQRCRVIILYLALIWYAHKNNAAACTRLLNEKKMYKKQRNGEKNVISSFTTCHNSDRRRPSGVSALRVGYLVSCGCMAHVIAVDDGDDDDVVWLLALHMSWIGPWPLWCLVDCEYLCATCISSYRYARMKHFRCFRRRMCVNSHVHSGHRFFLSIKFIARLQLTFNNDFKCKDFMDYSYPWERLMK